MKKLFLIVLFFSFNLFAQPNPARINELRSGTKIDSQDTVVFDLLEEFYTQALQSDLGELSSDMPKRMDKLYQNKKTKNRHLLVMFMAYQNHISETVAVGKKSDTKFQIELINDLAYEFKTIFNKIPAIIYIYQFESLSTIGQKEVALKTIEEGLIAYPNSIPLKVYKYLNLKEETIKTDLITNHSNHWMVKQFKIK